MKIGSKDKLVIMSKGVVGIQAMTGIKHISNVLFVHEIDQNLLSIGQMIQSGYCLLFKEKSCVITNVGGHELFEVEMRKRSFPAE